MSYRLKIVFLGTSATFPTVRRNHPGIFLEFLNEGILFDCGEGIQRQMRKAKISPTKITKILITHWHGDHVLGLPGIFQSLVNLDYNKTLHLYGPIGIKEKIKKVLEAFDISLNFKIKIFELEKTDKIKKFFENKEFELYYTYGEHSIDTISYCFKEKDKIKVDKDKLIEYGIEKHPKIKILKEGKTVEINGKILRPEEFLYLKKGIKVCYITDTIYKDNLKDLAKDADILIIEGMYLKEDKDLAKEHMHLSLEDVEKIGEEARIVFLTHISQRYEKNLEKFREEIKKIGNIFLSEDFLEIRYVKDIVEIVYPDGSKILFKRDEKTGNLMLIS